jgi:hypothetical protein
VGSLAIGTLFTLCKGEIMARSAGATAALIVISIAARGYRMQQQSHSSSTPRIPLYAGACLETTGAGPVSLNPVACVRNADPSMLTVRLTYQVAYTGGPVACTVGGVHEKGSQTVWCYDYVS